MTGKRYNAKLPTVIIQASGRSRQSVAQRLLDDAGVQKYYRVHVLSHKSGDPDVAPSHLAVARSRSVILVTSVGVIPHGYADSDARSSDGARGAVAVGLSIKWCACGALGLRRSYPPELQEEQALALALAEATEGGVDTLCGGLGQLMPSRLNQLLDALEVMGLIRGDDRSVY